jgi:hypothetical protein
MNSPEAGTEFSPVSDLRQWVRGSVLALR